MGLARLALAVLAAGAAVTLLFVGGRALLGSFGAAQESERARAASPTPPSAASAEATAQVPTVRIECVADTCPIVTVRVPGGDVLQHREMSGGEEVSYFDPELDVVISDAGAVRVTVNGKLRESAGRGTKDSFTVQADNAG
ncbi:RodZ domain-containing protein [Nonomuraea sp. B12E4]|uniref:RodZ domain-containing protein n=1 Tax=Nonomuraea sp. B12E4 TaxID=3153564 RepID=UPI00325C8E0E